MLPYAVGFVRGSHGDGDVWLFVSINAHGIVVVKDCFWHMFANNSVKNTHSCTTYQTPSNSNTTPHLFPTHHPYLQSTALTLSNSPSLSLAKIIAFGLLLGSRPAALGTCLETVHGLPVQSRLQHVHSNPRGYALRPSSVSRRSPFSWYQSIYSSERSSRSR